MAPCRGWKKREWTGGCGRCACTRPGQPPRTPARVATSVSTAPAPRRQRWSVRATGSRPRWGGSGSLRSYGSSTAEGVRRRPPSASSTTVPRPYLGTTRSLRWCATPPPDAPPRGTGGNWIGSVTADLGCGAGMIALLACWNGCQPSPEHLGPSPRWLEATCPPGPGLGALGHREWSAGPDAETRWTGAGKVRKKLP